MPHDLLTLFSTKIIEYPLALLYLTLFVPFWRYVSTEKAVRQPAVAQAPATAKAPAWRGLAAELFRVPERLFYHPGHAWARVDGDVVTVGLDDFAQKLVGPLAAVQLPAIGSVVAQGAKGWTLVGSDAKTVDMLSPVDGTVIATNDGVAAAADGSDRDPYVDGWLLKIRNSGLAENLKQLMTGSLARRWMEDACEALDRINPELGPVLADGGAPIAGMARAVEPDNWDELAKQFFLS